MRAIDNCSAQSISGKTSEVANLPTTETVMDDGTVFKAACGSTFLDIETGDIYMLVGSEWKKL